MLATPWLRAAALAFRSLPFSRSVNKVIHALIQTLGLAASTGGLATVIIFKDKTGNLWDARANFKPKSGKYTVRVAARGTHQHLSLSESR